ncbi:MAG: signal recognition particle-docking protein FtsY [Nanoarchaeota archaeon]|nr:signal recognition particle-docking protein FtsY [Nanoarchaeota archaeon]
MFKFLKEKLKSAISKISEGVEKEGKVEETLVEKPAEEAEKREEKGFFAKLKEKFVGKEKEEVEEEKQVIEEKKIELKPEFEEKKEIKPKIEVKREDKLKTTEHKEKEYIKAKEEAKHPIKKQEEKPKEEQIKKEIEIPKREHKEPEKKGFFETIKEKIITTKINEEQFDKLFWELELALMENNVAVEVIEKIKNDLKNELVERPIKRTKVEETIQATLKNSIKDLFEITNIDLIQEIKNKKEKPYIIAFFGINGSGKTTSIAKIANMLKDKKISCVLAASDTFRAASIEQLQQHADKIGINLIKHDYGSDPAAVAFDAIKHAKAKNIDVVLIDTAGRMHSNVNLIDEMKKIIRVAKPDLKVFVGESITGNDCVEQAKTFNEAVGIDGVILAKADIDEKGGAAVSVSYVTKKPILFLGTGQKYGDLQVFDSEIIIKNLGLS